MERIKYILGYNVAEISVGDVLIVLGCVVAGLIVDKIFQRVMDQATQRLERFKHQDRWHYSAFCALDRPVRLLCLTLGCGLGLVIIDTPPWGEEVFDIIFRIMRLIAVWCAVWYLLLLTAKIAEQQKKKAMATDDKLDGMLIPIISGIVRFFIIATGALIAVQDLGYSISSVIAGLGIGGAAIALASRDTIANIFGSLVVFFDKPFQVGDWVSVNAIEGEVEEIRLRNMLIRTIDNSLVMMPNSLLTNTSINNYQRRTCRRMDCSFGLLYTTTADQVEEIVAEIKKHITTRTDLYAKPHFVGFGGFDASSLRIEVTAYTHKTGRADHFVDRQAFLLEIMRIVERAGTGFGFPRQTIDLAPNLPRLPIQIVAETDK
ncbi:MAG: mechanosensitive ion channel family protein [Proteobacteria bacterium]|nr:mechanosensitive ion channel family protein [Pseudomonadota bacterium]